MTTSINIYFDESGITGNKLLDNTQTVFSYASVRVDDEEARDFVNSIINRYEIKNTELKGSKLLGYRNNRGKKAISEILSHFEGRFKVYVSDKKYALATNFFEYIFEPTFENSYLFYKIDFHRFISNILYVGLAGREVGVEKILEDFQDLIRNKDFENFDSIFSINSSSEIESTFAQIKEFAILNKSTILDEIDRNPKWVLDLTSSALFLLLGQWGQEFEQLTIFCDESKPLEECRSLFNEMINRKDKKYSPISQIPITFNLSSPLELVTSS